MVVSNVFTLSVHNEPRGWALESALSAQSHNCVGLLESLQVINMGIKEL